MADQLDITDKGGTMRLGVYPCVLVPGTKAAAAYGVDMVMERHRHRFEFNNKYRRLLEAAGFVISGHSPDGRLVEIIELRDHPWYVGTQFHPEFLSRPNRPHPLFRDFVAAAAHTFREGDQRPLPLENSSRTAMGSRCCTRSGRNRRGERRAAVGIGHGERRTKPLPVPLRICARNRTEDTLLRGVLAIKHLPGQ